MWVNYYSAFKIFRFSKYQIEEKLVRKSCFNEKCRNNQIERNKLIILLKRIKNKYPITKKHVDILK